MKKIIFPATFLIFIISVHGFTEASEAPSLGIEAGFETSHITYKEPSIMEEKGIMYGVNAALNYNGPLFLFPEAMDGYMAAIEGHASFGAVDYTSTNSGSINDIDDYMLELRGLLGYSFSASESLTFTPYIGYGYRYLNDDMGGKVSTTGAGGYERETSYIYSPIGIDLSSEFENNWSVKLRLEYDHFYEGHVKSHLGQIAGYYDVKMDQDGGHGYRCSMKFKKRGERIDFSVEPFVRYWSIKNSKYAKDPDGVSWHEPKNNSKEYGVNFAIGY